MKRTEHYNLGINEGTDIVNGLIPFNENMETIDSELFKQSGGIVTKATELSFQNNTLFVTASSNIFYFVSPINYASSVTIQINGVAPTCVTPDGKSLNPNCFVINSNIIVIFNADNNIATFIVGQNDAYSLGGFLPTHYATQDSIKGINEDIQNLANMFNIVTLNGETGSTIIHMGVITKISFSITINSNTNKYFTDRNIYRAVVIDEVNDPNNILNLKDNNINYGGNWSFNSTGSKSLHAIVFKNGVKNFSPVFPWVVNVFRNNGKLTFTTTLNSNSNVGAAMENNPTIRVDYVFLNGNISIPDTI